jgi:CheY-like chemotaxis protein
MNSPTPNATEHGLPAALRVLCVDDESMIGDLVSGILCNHLGYAVKIARNGEEALAVLKTDTDFDLLVVDFVMPRMNGAEFYRRLTRKHPDLVSCFMFITGDTLNDETLEFIESTGRKLLEKPFGMPDLTAALRDLVANGAVRPRGDRR